MPLTDLTSSLRTQMIGQKHIPVQYNQQHEYAKLPGTFSHLAQAEGKNFVNSMLGSGLESIRQHGKFEDFYVLGRELGRGQFGVVHLAMEKSTSSPVACKILSKRRFCTE